MYKIVSKESLNPTVSKMVIEAPLIAKKAEPGQFIIFRAKEDSELRLRLQILTVKQELLPLYTRLLVREPWNLIH